MKTEPPSSNRPLVIINGISTPRFVASAFGLLFRLRGFRVFTADQTFLNYGDIRTAARLVDEKVKEALAETRADKVDLIGMSLGGLIGLYYVKCGGGARYVDRFISLGGPLKGSPLAYLSLIPPFEWMTSLGQTRPESDIIRELREAKAPEGVRIYSVGTSGDWITPRSVWDAEGAIPVETSGPEGYPIRGQIGNPWR